jgi:ABC-2 type transport system ATP-binding protein
MGMVGGSYGGGIQLVTAATDCRVDAIVPTIAWHSLVTSLDKSDTVKIGWSNLLTSLSATDRVDPEVTASHAAGDQNGQITAAERLWFAERGPGGLVARVRVPTLIIQGTVDTLFTLQEGAQNYALLRDHGVPTSMVWFCGGHGVCLTPPGDETLVLQATLAWLNRYVKRDTSVGTGPGFQFVDQNGTQYTSPYYPPAPGRPVRASGSGTLPLVAAGGSGPVAVSGSVQVLAGLVAPITPGPAVTAVNVRIPLGNRSVVVVGAPRVTLTYRGTVAAGTRPTRVFAQLVDPTTGLVLGNQVTPIAVTLDGRPHITSVPLEMVAYTGRAHTSVNLQLVATTVAYAPPRLGGSVHFTHIAVSLPAAADITPR